jgi:hypothetical protein
MRRLEILAVDITSERARKAEIAFDEGSKCRVYCYAELGTPGTAYPDSYLKDLLILWTARRRIIMTSFWVRLH